MPNQVTTNDIGRVFIQPKTGLLACCPEYLGCIGVSGISQDRTENLTIRCASDTQAGQYDVIDKVPGILNQITFDMNGYLGLQGISILRQLFQDNCNSTVHIHYGKCNNVQNFVEFDKAIILDDVLLNSYGTDDLVALTPDNRNVITETVSAEAVSMYEYFQKKRFSLVSQIDEVSDFQLQLMPGYNCNICTFCPTCDYKQCTENFYTIPSGDGIVKTLNDSINVYTVEDTGAIKQWNYESILDGELVCETLITISLEVGETITTADLYDGKIIFGTSEGSIAIYDIKKNKVIILLTLANAISEIIHNEFGILVADNMGDIYYSEDSNSWSAATSTGAGAVTALLLYSKTSWLVANLNGNIYYTNNNGEDYTFKKYPKVTGQYIKQFELSNDLIINAINDTYFYQSFDGGCTFSAIDLSKYFSSLFSIAVCPENPFIVYIAGLSVDTLKSYIVEINFGA